MPPPPPPSAPPQGVLPTTPPDGPCCRDDLPSAPHDGVVGEAGVEDLELAAPKRWGWWSNGHACDRPHLDHPRADVVQTPPNTETQEQETCARPGEPMGWATRQAVATYGLKRPLRITRDMLRQYWTAVPNAPTRATPGGRRSPQGRKSPCVARLPTILTAHERNDSTPQHHTDALRTEHSRTTDKYATERVSYRH